MFDNNAYANDPRTQFMNWAVMANAAWDYPADSLGYTTGIAIELNRPRWTLRCVWLLPIAESKEWVYRRKPIRYVAGRHFCG